MSVPRTLRRLLLILGGAVAALAIAAAPANAAGVHKGFLTLSVTTAPVVAPVVTQLPPGKAVAAAQAACVGRAPAVPPVAPAVLPVVIAPGDLTVDGVRNAFPNPVTVCTGVTLLSQVAAGA